MKRCEWPGDDPLYQRYHDREWGVPLHNDKKLFEFLILEGAQAGLSWITILRKRDNFRKAFDNFDFNKVAKYGERDVKRLLKDAGIIRNELKIRSAIKNARAYLDVRKEFGTFNFVGSTIVYSHMQATGMVNDHAVYCFRHKEVKQLAGK